MWLNWETAQRDDGVVDAEEQAALADTFACADADAIDRVAVWEREAAMAAPTALTTGERRRQQGLQAAAANIRQRLIQRYAQTTGPADQFMLSGGFDGFGFWCTSES